MHTDDLAEDYRVIVALIGAGQVDALAAHIAAELVDHNHMLHIAVTQIRLDTEGWAYYRQRTG